VSLELLELLAVLELLALLVVLAVLELLALLVVLVVLELLALQALSTPGGGPGGGPPACDALLDAEVEESEESADVTSLMNALSAAARSLISLAMLELEDDVDELAVEVVLAVDVVEAVDDDELDVSDDTRALRSLSSVARSFARSVEAELELVELLLDEDEALAAPGGGPGGGPPTAPVDEAVSDDESVSDDEDEEAPLLNCDRNASTAAESPTVLAASLDDAVELVDVAAVVLEVDELEVLLWLARLACNSFKSML
jgi:hypothetical protein